MSEPMRAMDTAPRDGTIVVVYHKATSEPLAAGFFAFDQRAFPLWRYIIPHEPRPDFKGYVAESNLSGWLPLPAIAWRATK